MERLWLLSREGELFFICLYSFPLWKYPTSVLTYSTHSDKCRFSLLPFLLLISSSMRSKTNYTDKSSDKFDKTDSFRKQTEEFQMKRNSGIAYLTKPFEQRDSVLNFSLCKFVNILHLKTKMISGKVQIRSK